MVTKSYLPLLLFAGLGASLLAGVACGSDGGARASETATVTPAATTERDGPDGLRALARQLDTALKKGDTAFLAGHMRTVDITCTAADVNPQGAGGPTCKAVGEQFKGFEVAGWRSEGAIAPVENTVQQFEMLFKMADASASDKFGTGAPRVHSLNADPGNYTIVFTAIVNQPWRSNMIERARVVYASSWWFGEGKWQMTRLLTAYVLGEELLTPGSEYTNRMKAREEFQP